MFRSASLALAAALLAGATFAAEPASGPPMVKDGMFVNGKGMTVYTFDKDAPGKSMCNGQCAANWPPLYAMDGDKAMGDYSIIARDDGKKQWAFKGKPLYFWAKDMKPGDKTGDGFKDVWRIVKP